MPDGITPRKGPPDWKPLFPGRDAAIWTKHTESGWKPDIVLERWALETKGGKPEELLQTQFRA